MVQMLARTAFRQACFNFRFLLFRSGSKQRVDVQTAHVFTQSVSLGRLDRSVCTTNAVVEGSMGEAPAVSDVPGADPKERLINWVRMNGGTVGRVEIQDSPLSGLGVFATDDFLTGDALFSIPMHLTIMAYPFDEVAKVDIPPEELPDTAIRLAAKLVQEKNRNHRSPWLPYIEALPGTLTNPTLMLNGNLGMNHAGFPLFNEILENYSKTVDFMVGEMNLKEEDVRLGLAAVQSRAFGNGVGQELLVPLADFMNHGDSITNDVFTAHPCANVNYGWNRKGTGNTPKDWEMVVRASKTISKGEEVLVSYGDHQNEYFLLYYGFVPLYNPRDDFLVFSGLNEALEWFCKTYPDKVGGLSRSEQEQLLEQVKVGGDMKEVVKLNVCADGSVSPIMLEFFMMLCDQDEEQAAFALSRACFESLAQWPCLVDDLHCLASSFGDEPNSFRYHHLDYEKDIDEFLNGVGVCRREMWKGSGHSDSESGAMLEVGSKPWWFRVHGALKKMIAWDFVLEMRPTREALGL